MQMQEPSPELRSKVAAALPGWRVRVLHVRWVSEEAMKKKRSLIEDIRKATDAYNASVLRLKRLEIIRESQRQAFKKAEAAFYEEMTVVEGHRVVIAQLTQAEFADKKTLRDIDHLSRTLHDLQDGKIP